MSLTHAACDQPLMNSPITKLKFCHSERSEESQKKHTQEIERDSTVATFLRNDTARYRKAYLNGKRVEGTTITHRDIISGGILEFN